MPWRETGGEKGVTSLLLGSVGRTEVTNMDFTQIISLLVFALFCGMLILSELGRQIGRVKIARDPEGFAKGIGTAEGAVFGLLGLIIAFTFSGAASRFENRRHLITEEANAIGTAYLRIDLLPDDTRPEMRELFRRYAYTRAVTYLRAGDVAATKARLAEGAALQREIWKKALTACRRPEAPAQAGMLLLPALNAMIDITTTREMATQNHPPLTIFLLLGGLSLVAALLVGYGMSGNRERDWLHTLAFAALVSLAVFVITDLEFPRRGLIRIDAADQALVEVRKGMK